MTTALMRLDRSLLLLAGRDARKFLQGLTTNDVLRLAADDGAAGADAPRCVYTGLNNAKGRVLFEAFVWGAGAGGDLLLDCDAAARDGLEAHLTQFRLRSKVEVSDVSERFAVASVLQGGGGAAAAVAERDVLASAVDPRCAAMGRRLLLDAESPLCADVGDAAPYRLKRTTLGLAEGVAEIPPTEFFPAELGLDYSNGISYEKGCYLGQELTARTHFQGLVRKRVMPCHVSPSRGPPEDASRLIFPVDAQGERRESGRLLHDGTGTEGVGLASLRLDRALDPGVQLLTSCGRQVQPYLPVWWALAGKDVDVDHVLGQ